MKRIPFFAALFYIYILLGFVFHTSTKATILHKYTYSYFLLLILLAIFFFPFLYICKNIIITSKLKIKKRVFIINPYKKFLLIFIVFIILFAGLEIYLRNKYPISQTVWGPSIESYHPFLQSQQSLKGDLHINSKGFRGEEISVIKPQGTVRIFVLGGSTVLSSNVKYDKSSVKILSDLIKGKYPNKLIEVMNAGNDWYTTEHSIIQYLFKIKDYSPDMVIMWQGINDLYWSCSPSSYSYLPYKADYSHFYGAVSNTIINKFITKPFLNINSLAYDFINHTLKYNLYSDFKSKNPIPRKIENYGGIKNYKFKSTNSYNRNLESFIKILKDDQVEVIIGNQANIYKPNLNQNELQRLWLLKSFCNEKGNYPDIKSSIDGIALLNKNAEQIAAKYQIPFADLNKEIPKNLNYFIDDVHTTEKGDKIIAETLFKVIKDNIILNNDL